jgi:hypothetical protein
MVKENRTHEMPDLFSRKNIYDARAMKQALREEPGKGIV